MQVEVCTQRSVYDCIVTYTLVRVLIIRPAVGKFIVLHYPTARWEYVRVLRIECVAKVKACLRVSKAFGISALWWPVVPVTSIATVAGSGRKSD